MASVFSINGIAAQLAPYSQRWRQVIQGRDHSQRTILAGNEEIDLSFDSASITMAREWLDAASGGSLNLTVLNRWGNGYTDLSAVNLEVVEYPTIEAGVSGPWSMVIHGASAA